MAFKTVVAKVRRAILCAGKEEQKHCLEIGAPTDVRKIDVCESILGLSINDPRTPSFEKPTNDPIRLLSLQSHPPNQPPSIYSLSLPPSRETSQPLLNAASANLPSNLPTPPRHKHTDNSPPPSHRMKTMWERTRRLSSSLSLSNLSSCGYQEFDMLNTGTRGGTTCTEGEAGTKTGAGTETEKEKEKEKEKGTGRRGEGEGEFLLDLVNLDFKNGGEVTPNSLVSLHGSENGKSVGGDLEMRDAGIAAWKSGN